MINARNVDTPKVVQVMIVLAALVLSGSSIVLSFNASADIEKSTDVQTVSHAATATPLPGLYQAGSDGVGFSIVRTINKEVRPTTPLPLNFKEVDSADEYFDIIVRGEDNFRKEEELLLGVAKHLPFTHFGALDKIFLIYDDPNARRGLGGATKMILRVVNVGRDEFISLFVHELGHSVDLGVLDGSSNKETNFYDGVIPVVADDPSLDFYRISWKGDEELKDDAREEDFVSGYAATDCFEDFAESYLYYVLHGREFRKIKKGNNALAKKYEFIKMLFVGREFDTGHLSNIGEERPWDATKLRLDGSLVTRGK